MLTYDFSTFPVLQTDRLLLRRPADSDVNEIFEMRSDRDNMRFIPRPLLQDREQALDHVRIINEQIDRNEGINWAVTLKGDDRLIGLIGFYRTEFEHFRSEIGYMIHPDFHGRGIVSEAITRLLEYAFSDMNLHSVVAVIDPENIASEKVLQKTGFLKEAHFRENEFYDGKFIDSVHYSILNK